MARSKQTVDVDRELELLIEVTDSGVLLRLADDKVKAELKPGDRLLLVLRPVKPEENQDKSNDDKADSSGGDTWISQEGDFTDTNGGVWFKPHDQAAGRPHKAGDGGSENFMDSFDDKDSPGREDQ